MENIEIKEMVNPLSASVQAVNNEMRHLRDSVDKLHNDQTTLAKQVNNNMYKIFIKNKKAFWLILIYNFNCLRNIHI